MRKTTALFAVGVAWLSVSSCAGPGTRAVASSDLLDRAEKALNRGEIGETIRLLEGRVDDSIRGSRLLGLAFLAVRQFDLARAAFSTALRLDASDLETWIAMAHACEEDRLFERAIESYEKALSINPNHPKVALLLAQLLADLHRTSEAVRALIRAMELNPDNLELRTRIGSVEFERGENLSSIAAYDLVLSRAPEHTPALIGRALARAAIATRAQNPREDASKALSDLESAMRLAVDDPAPAYNRGWIYEEIMLDAYQAEANYREAIRRRADYYRALVRLAPLVHSRGEVIEALSLYNRARAATIDPRIHRDIDTQVKKLRAETRPANDTKSASAPKPP